MAVKIKVGAVRVLFDHGIEEPADVTLERAHAMAADAAAKCSAGTPCIPEMLAERD